MNVITCPSSRPRKILIWICHANALLMTRAWRPTNRVRVRSMVSVGKVCRIRVLKARSVRLSGRPCCTVCWNRVRRPLKMLLNIVTVNVCIRCALMMLLCNRLRKLSNVCVLRCNRRKRRKRMCRVSRSGVPSMTLTTRLSVLPLVRNRPRNGLVTYARIRRSPMLRWCRTW